MMVQTGLERLPVTAEFSSASSNGSGPAWLTDSDWACWTAGSCWCCILVYTVLCHWAPSGAKYSLVVLCAISSVVTQWSPVTVSAGQSVTERAAPVLPSQPSATHSLPGILIQMAVPVPSMRSGNTYLTCVHVRPVMLCFAMSLCLYANPTVQSNTAAYFNNLLILIRTPHYCRNTKQ